LKRQVSLFIAKHYRFHIDYLREVVGTEAVLIVE